MSRNTPETFWARVRRGEPDACWPWVGHLNSHGYGDCYYQGRRTNAHRIAFELATGERPPREAVVCHRCDNRACCNPAHLWLGSQGDNVRDCRDKGRARGTFNGGARHPRHTAKLTQEQVEWARSAYADGMRQTAIAAQLGVHSATISRLVRGERRALGVEGALPRRRRPNAPAWMRSRSRAA